MAQKSSKKTEAGTKRSYLSQADVPAHSLDHALRVPKAITDSYGKNPTKPLRVAEAMGILPGSSGFRMLCGASIAYGLTEGGYNSDTISLTGLGRRIVAPTKEGDDVLARREALLRPRVFREFLTKYNGSKLPSDHIGGNVLEEMGVPSDRKAEVFQMVVEGARTAGFVVDVKGQAYVDLDAAAQAAESSIPAPETAEPDSAPIKPAIQDPREEVIAPTAPIRRNGRVFITHGKNRDIVAQLKDLLTFGSFTPVVAMEHETASKPVPEKVLGEMRSCDAAIIHVGTETRLIDSEGKEHKMLNQNVLIEIGAAMALYGHKFILLVEKGVTLPSNLQGLYEVRYEGDKLDYEATMKLLRAFNDFRA